MTELKKEKVVPKCSSGLALCGVVYSLCWCLSYLELLWVQFKKKKKKSSKTFSPPTGQLSETLKLPFISHCTVKTHVWKKQHRFFLSMWLVTLKETKYLFVSSVSFTFFLPLFVSFCTKKKCKKKKKHFAGLAAPSFLLCSPRLSLWVCHSTGESGIRNSPDAVWPGTDFTGVPRVCFKQRGCEILLSGLVGSFLSLTDYSSVPWGQSKTIILPNHCILPKCCVLTVDVW